MKTAANNIKKPKIIINKIGKLSLLPCFITLACYVVSILHYYPSHTSSRNNLKKLSMLTNLYIWRNTESIVI